jgi:integrase/recombinase XerD
LTIPISARLAEAIACTKTTGLTSFLVDSRGRTFSPKAFGGWFSEAAKAAGVEAPLHGCRKLSLSRLASNGATAFEVQAISGHRSLSQLQVYTRNANQAVLAKSAMNKAGTKTV